MKRDAGPRSTRNRTAKDRFASERQRIRVEEALERLTPPGVHAAVRRAFSDGGPSVDRGRPSPDPARCSRALRDAGRRCALAALERAGLAAPTLRHEPDGAPSWPGGATGSVSHSGGLAAAVASRLASVAGLGLDIERRDRLAVSRAPLFCTPSELEWLQRRPRGKRPRLALVLFCAKESAQKCLRGASGRLPGPLMLRVALRPGDGRFDATLLDSRRRRGPSVARGRFIRRSGYLIAVAVALASPASG